MPADLERVYRAYVETLNERRLDELGRFVHDELVYNGQRWTLARYVTRLADDLATIPDLHYDLQLVLADGDQVAARLGFSCSPRGEFLGVATDGRRVDFAEHVFYRFRGQRIEQVWSLIDTDAIRRTLATDPRP